ncbi:MAG: hypothetical protein JF603_08270 [Acidobacteria bacterium]|nr:hypothetical protein [Acidobacteriota bacterium]
MPTKATTDDVRRLIDKGAQVVEVLPRSSYDAEHLPGAVNVPLDGLRPEALAGLDPTVPTVVYCYDHECDLSPRGAALLEVYGFAEVYDYVASKTAWLAAGLPTEGTTRPASRAGAIASSLPTCRASDHIGDLERATRVVVVDDDGVVLGIVPEEALALPPETHVLDAMQPAPPTVRPSITASELASTMDEDGRPYVLVSTYGGGLLGEVRREALHGQH